MKVRLSFVLLITTLLLLSAVVTAQVAQVPSDVNIVDANVTAFPNVRFTARVLDSSGQAIRGLSASNFSLSENFNQPLSVVERIAPITTVFIILSQPNSNLEQNLYAEIITAYGGLAHQSGDTLAYTFTSDSQVFEVNTIQDLVTVVQNHTYNNEGNLTAALDRTMAFLTPKQQANEQVQAVLIGSYINREISNTYANIPLHVLHAHTTRPQYESNFRSLATGQFLSVARIDAGMNTFLNQINNNHVVYDVAYSSRTAQTGLRNVQVTVSANGGSSIGILNYQADILAPEISIARTESNEFRLERNVDTIATPSATTDGQYRFNKNSETLSINITFSDGQVRPIESAWLVIDGVEQARIVPAMNGNSFDIQWDLTPYEQSTTVGIAVGIQDYYGLSRVSQTTSYEIIVPDFVTPILELNPCVNLDGTPKTSAECTIAENATVTIAVLVVQILSLLALIAVIIWQRRSIGSAIRSGTQLAGTFAHSVADVGRKTSIAFTNFASGRTTDIEGTSVEGTNYENMKTSDTNYTPSAHKVTQIEQKVTGATVIEGAIPPDAHVAVPDDALAMFIVEQGLAKNGNTIIMRDNMTHIIFGRDEEYGVNTEAIILMNGVSSVHCRISYSHSNREFTIKDEKSTNGTYVNNQKLPENGSVVLTPNVQIRLGKKFAMRFLPNSRYVDVTASSQMPKYNPPKSTKFTLIEDDELEQPDIHDTKSNPKMPAILPNGNNPSANQKPQKGKKEEDADPWLD